MREQNFWIISSKFDKSEVITAHASVFDELGACFVTLKKQGDLRGCIGSIIAHQTLISDLIDNAQNAAFWDPRFEPVEEDEVDNLTIDTGDFGNNAFPVSISTRMRAIENKSVDCVASSP